MTIDQQNLIGCLCVLRSKTGKIDLPKDLPLVTARSDGTAYIKSDIKKVLLGMADQDMLRRWHSRAADWCIDHDRGLSERSYHMMLAHRYRELVRLIKSKRYSLMDDLDSEMVKIIQKLACECKDPLLMDVSVRMLIDSNNLKDAENILTEMAVIDPISSRRLLAELRLREHRFDETMQVLDDLEMNHPDELIVKGVYHLWTGDPIGARENLVKAKELMLKTNNIFRMDVVLAYEAFALMEMNMTSDAKNVMKMSADICRNEKRRAELRILSERLFPSGSEDSILLERIDVGDVKIPDVLYVPFKHGQSLKAESPCKDRCLDTEGCQDLWSEHACSSELHPLAVEEDLDLQ